MSERRKSVGISQADLARAVGLSQFMVSKYERGAAEFTVSRLKDFADTLGTTVQELVRTVE